jgi:hypothetical protein
VNKGVVNITPWGQISPLGARGEVKNDPLDQCYDFFLKTPKNWQNRHFRLKPMRKTPFLPKIGKYHNIDPRS